jgi:hypothetical protein
VASSEILPSVASALGIVTSLREPASIISPGMYGGNWLGATTLETHIPVSGSQVLPSSQIVSTHFAESLSTYSATRSVGTWINASWTTMGRGPSFAVTSMSTT